MGQPYFIPVGRSSRLFVVLALGLASAAMGQTTPDQGSSSTPSNTTLVRDVDEVPVDMVIHGKKKALVNRTSEDFAFTDDGAAVKLGDLRLVTGRSNHLVRLLFDALDPSAATNARDVARKILKVMPTEEFSFAVFKVDRRLRILQEFTTNRQEIQKAITAATSEAEGTSSDEVAAVAEKRLISAVQSGAGQAQSSASAYDRDVEQAMLASIRETQRIMQDRQPRPVLASLLGLRCRSISLRALSSPTAQLLPSLKPPSRKT